MRDLTTLEMEAVSGGELTQAQAAALTVGLMAIGAASPIVIGVGVAALLYYAWC